LKYYLDFEKPLRILDEEIYLKETIMNPSAENTKEVAILIEKRLKKINEIYSGLSRWQRVQLARHPERPYSKDYIDIIFEDFIELHGDRLYSDDPAVICGIAKLDRKKVVIIAQQKGRNTKDNLYRNFGMMRPEGYRKALRIMKLAEKFNLPVITFMDTPGAFPGIGAEERGQGEAIARNLLEMSSLKVPIVSIVIGEGASGGALGIGVCDSFLMMQNTWYSVISPEGCASILFRDATKAEEAAEALKVIPDDLVKMGICDKIIEEPNGGAHRDIESSSQNLKSAILSEIKELETVDPLSFIDLRIQKYDKLGVYEDLK
jgi:acetyl-CoA carboxylase carboxyl transferase subunit alpha|tara:strand:+ start:2104 stop:3060 length:957 start_codon:yes stop_codon:yes gene_type:complete